MKKCIVFGTSYFAEMLTYYMEKFSDCQVVAYTVDAKYRKEDTLYGRKFVDYEEVQKLYPPNEYTFIVALGYNSMNQLRKEKFRDIKDKGYTIETFIHPTAAVTEATLGEGCIVLENVSLGYGVQLSDGCIIWNGCNISHHSRIGAYSFVAPGSVLGGVVTLGKQCFLGLNSTIRSGVILGDKTLVGAGTYINGDTEPESVHVPPRSVELKGKISRDLL